MAVPVLHTDRLKLSGHRPDDLDALAAMWADPLVYRHIGGKARTREEVWTRLLRHVGQWTVFGHGLWVVRDQTTGEVLGEVGLIDSRRAIEPTIDGVPEGAWVLASAVHGQGLGREALGAALAWADGQGIGRTLCIVDPDNTASLGLAERVGYRPLPDAVYRGVPTRVFAREAQA